MDDFYKPSDQQGKIEDQIGSSFDWERLEKSVLEPLSNSKVGKYQRYDWDKDCLLEWHEVQPTELVIIEGVYSTRKELRHLYDYRIWVNTPQQTRLMRGISRDGETSREMWTENWMPAEQLYEESHQPAHYAHQTLIGEHPDILDLATHFAREVV